MRASITSKRKFHIIIVSPESGRSWSPLSARNPVRRMLELIEDRGFSDEVYLIRTSDLSVMAFLPPLIPQ